MIKEDIKQITNVNELQRLYIELNNEIERLEVDYSQANDIIIEQQKEIERLNNILKEVRESIENQPSSLVQSEINIIKILDKAGVDKEWKK